MLLKALVLEAYLPRIVPKIANGQAIDPNPRSTPHEASKWPTLRFAEEMQSIFVAY